MPKTRPIEMHIAAIKAGEVTRTNVIGLRKALNNHERQERGYSVSVTATNIKPEERDLILDKLLPNSPPIVRGELHDTGIALLKNKRYAKQLERVADIVTNLDHFRLVGFDYIGQYGDKTTPVYRAYDTKGNSFPFCNVPWQSGGHGPEVLSGNLW